MSLVWHPATEEELTEAALYYELRQPGLGNDLIDEVLAAASLILADPRRAREFDPPYRKLKTRRFSYQLIYEVGDSEIRVIAVMHQSRAPGYWRSRGQTWE